MDHINRLPTEVLQLVFSYALKDLSKFSQFFNISTTCSRWFPIVLSFSPPHIDLRSIPCSQRWCNRILKVQHNTVRELVLPLSLDYIYLPEFFPALEVLVLSSCFGVSDEVLELFKDRAPALAIVWLNDAKGFTTSGLNKFSSQIRVVIDPLEHIKDCVFVKEFYLEYQKIGSIF